MLQTSGQPISNYFLVVKRVKFIKANCSRIIMTITKPYEWLIAPDAIKDRTAIRVLKGKPLSLSDRQDIAQLIENEWKSYNERLMQEGRLKWVDVSTPRYRLTDHDVDNKGRLVVKLAPAEYKLTATTHDLAEGKPEVFAAIKNAGKLPYIVGVSCSAETKNRLMLILERSQAVDVGRGLYHVVGGSPHPEDYLPENIPPEKRLETAKHQIYPARINLLEAVRRQLREETGLEKGTYEIQVAGIAQDPAILQPEIIFCSRASKTFEEILALPKQAGWETKQFHGWTRERTTQETTTNPQKFVSVGIAALDAHRLIYGAR